MAPLNKLYKTAFGIACLLFSYSTVAQKTGVTVKSVSQVFPLFKNYDENPAISIAVYASEQTTANTELKSLSCQLNEEGLKNIELIEIYATGAEAFNKEKPVTSIRPTLPVFEVPMNVPVIKGVTKYWFNIILRNTASIDQFVRLSCNNIQLTGGQKIPVQQTGKGYTKRIGNAVRKAGDDQVNTYRIPGIVQTDKGTILAVYDIRYKNSSDLPGNIDVGLSRSTNNGQTWEPMKIVMDMGEPHENNGVGDPAILFDPVTKKIWVVALWSKGNRSIAGSKPGLSPDTTGQLVIISSNDDGLNWTKPVSITPAVKKPEWHLFFNGPGTGIAMKNGTLVFAAQYWDAKRKPYSTIIYSKDHGANWQGKIDGPKENTTESQVVETTDGILMLNMRDNRGQYRSIATTKDLGSSWTEHRSSYDELLDPVCMASIMKKSVGMGNGKKDILFFSNPATISGRYNMTIKASTDMGLSWQPAHQLLVDERMGYGYSSLTDIDQKTVGLLYEGSRHLFFIKVTVSNIINQTIK